MQEEELRREVRGWLNANLSPAAHADPLAWNRRLAEAGWTGIGWPTEHGGRGFSLAQQVAFHEEYAHSAAPERLGHLGEELLGPTLIAYGTPEQQRRFLPEILAVRELWCQGYSEPGAGSDLASVTTRASLDGDQWVINGQKVWTSLAAEASWCFLLARTEPGSTRHRGLSYLLVPMRQPGVTVRPIRQLTGESEFNEVFFDDARTERELVVGEVGQGWRVAMGTLAFERGVATLGRQIGFRRELAGLVALARASGAAEDPVLRDRLTRAWIGLEVMRAHALRTLGSAAPAEASVAKLVWARWHRDLGELAMEVLGAAGMLAGERLHEPPGVQSAGEPVAEPLGAEPAGEPLREPQGIRSVRDEWQRLFLFSRADTIYGGSDEIQRNIIAERVLGLPRQPRR